MVGLLHLISPPPLSRLRTYLWRLKKTAFRPEGFHKIWAYSLKNLCLLLCVPLENFVKIEASTPKEILNFYNLHQRNSIGPHPGEGVDELNVIVHYAFV